MTQVFGRAHEKWEKIRWNGISFWSGLHGLFLILVFVVRFHSSPELPLACVSYIAMSLTAVTRKPTPWIYTFPGSGKRMSFLVNALVDELEGQGLEAWKVETEDEGKKTTIRMKQSRFGQAEFVFKRKGDDLVGKFKVRKSPLLMWLILMGVYSLFFLGLLLPSLFSWLPFPALLQYLPLPTSLPDIVAFFVASSQVALVPTLVIIFFFYVSAWRVQDKFKTAMENLQEAHSGVRRDE